MLFFFYLFSTHCNLASVSLQPDIFCYDYQARRQLRNKVPTEEGRWLSFAVLADDVTRHGMPWDFVTRHGMPWDFVTRYGMP
jgi:hypothetical protein